MSIHVAILLPRYIDMILRGSKTVESRLTRRPIPPYRVVHSGDVIYFKASGGGYRALATAGPVHCLELGGPGDVDRLARRFSDTVCADEAYWDMKRESRFATFIELHDVRPTDTGPRLAPSRGPAWFVLQSRALDTFDIQLTDGALRNGYVRVPKALHQFPADAYAEGARAGRPVLLEMPDGQVVSTDIVRGGMLRWRGWRARWAAMKVKAGDHLRFEALGDRRYRVRVRRT